MSNSEPLIDLTSSDNETSIVMISDEDMTPDISPVKITPASKRKRDIVLQVETEERNEDMGVTDANITSAEFINMERLSPEPRRKNPDTTPGKPSPRTSAIADFSVPDVVSKTDLDSNLPETVTLLRTPDGVKVYVVGTAHFSQESQNDVSNIISAVQPDCVVIELCHARTDIIFWDEEALLVAAKEITMQKMLTIIRQSGVVHGLLYLTILTMSAHVTRELGMAPGGEFRTALKEVSKIPGCLLVLGDRAINVTFGRAFAGLSWWQSCKLFGNLIFSQQPIKKEDVENCKKKDMLEAALSELGGHYPTLKEVLVTERDKYLAYSLQNAAAAASQQHADRPCRVVGVVGLGHVPGIKKYWGTITEEEVAQLMTVPPPTLASKIMKVTIRGCLIGGVVYGLYKIVPVNRILRLITP